MVLIKFICCIIGLFSSTLYISALFSNNTLWDKKEIRENAKFRIINGLIMSVCFSVILIL